MRVFALLLIAGCSGASAPAGSAAPDPRPAETDRDDDLDESVEEAPVRTGELTLTVVGTSDLHGRVERVAVLSGYVRILRALRERDGGGVLLVDGGDMWQGTIESNHFEGEPVMLAYRRLGYDAATVGNHEFDYGPEGRTKAVATEPGDDPRGALRLRAREGGFPLLMANVLDAQTDRRPDWPEIRSRLVIERAGVRVGLVGITTMQTPETTIAANFAGLEMAPLAQTVEREARALRDEGATVVVVLAHAGGRCSRFDHPRDTGACESDEEAVVLARALPDGLVDVIVGGHTHQALAHEVDGIAVIQSWANGRAFGRVDLRIDRESGRVVRRDVRPPRALCASAQAPLDRCEPGTYEGEPVEIDEEMLEELERYLDEARAIRERPLGARAVAPFRMDYRAENALGNLLADLLKEARPNADVTMVNAGGIRTHLDDGEITYGDVYEVYPLDNRIALVPITGEALRRIIERNLGREGALSFSGIRAEARCQGGRLSVRVTRADGRAIRDGDRLTLATSDFLATGGDEVLERIEGTRIENDLLREVLVERISARGELRPDDPTIFDPARPRIRLPGERPFRCRR